MALAQAGAPLRCKILAEKRRKADEREKTRRRRRKGGVGDVNFGLFFTALPEYPKILELKHPFPSCHMLYYLFSYSR